MHCRRSAAISVMFLLLAATGCSGPPQTDNVRGPAPAAEGQPAAPEELQFTAETLAGAPFDGAELDGRDAVLWFWAPWCPQCQAEAPHVAAAQASAGDAVTFVGVAALAPIDDMRTFVSDYKVSAFDHIFDPDRKVWSRFGVSAQPAYAFIDDDGRIDVVRGVLGRAEIDARVTRLTAN